MGRIAAAFALCAWTALAAAVDEVPMTGLHAVGNQIHNAAGDRVFIHGVNRSGTEYACIQGWGMFDGPSDLASIAAIKSWNANAVRVPLNEDCWLGVNTPNAAYSGANYRSAVVAYVDLLLANNLAVILDLHWSAPGTQAATDQDPMPNADHSVDFWASVAATFSNRSGVIFDLFNEPFPDHALPDPAQAWPCLRDGGGACPGLGYTAAGLQDLLDAVRATGATNLVMASGLEWTNDLRQWLAWKPVDPQANLAASYHNYNFNRCAALDCWNAEIAPVAAQVPLVVGEIGTSTCDAAFLGALMGFLEGQQQNYLAWTWDTWGTGCGSIALIQDYGGTPTTYGAAYRDHLAGLPWTQDGAPPPPRTVVRNGLFETGKRRPWTLQLQPGGGASWNLTTTAPAHGAYAARIGVTAATPAEPWHVQFGQGVPLQAGRTYTLKFAARAALSRAAQAVVQLGAAPYTSYVVGDVALSTAWQVFRFTFTAPVSADGLLNFNLGQATGAVWLDDITLK